MKQRIRTSFESNLLATFAALMTVVIVALSVASIWYQHNGRSSEQINVVTVYAEKDSLYLERLSWT